MGRGRKFKPVKNIKTGKIYDSVRAAAKAAKVSEGTMSRWLSGNVPAAMDITWSFEDDSSVSQGKKSTKAEKSGNSQKSNNDNRIICIHEDGTQIMYNTMTEAATNYKVSTTSIKNVISGKSDSCHGLRFEYVDLEKKKEADLVRSKRLREKEKNEEAKRLIKEKKEQEKQKRMEERKILKGAFHPILDSNNWIFYDSVFEASKDADVDVEELKKVVTEGGAVVGGITWKNVVFIDDDPTLEQIQDPKTCYISKEDYDDFRQIQRDEKIAARLKRNAEKKKVASKETKKTTKTSAKKVASNAVKKTGNKTTKKRK